MPLCMKNRSGVWCDGGGDEISINTSTDAGIDKKAGGELFIVLLSERAKRDLTLFNSHSMFASEAQRLAAYRRQCIHGNEINTTKFTLRFFIECLICKQHRGCAKKIGTNQRIISGTDEQLVSWDLYRDLNNQYFIPNY